MNRINTFEIVMGPEALHEHAPAGNAPGPLTGPLQALVAGMSRRSADLPTIVYLCADDESTRARDDFAVVLARTLTAHVPSMLLVDCDFLHPGLSDRVPQKDALGFLDYLLYGSSIGVITQERDGVHLVGAGSFPVTKRMPFAESAFVDASKRLAAHARCAVFVGPAMDADGGRHPLSGVVDVVVTVRTGTRQVRLDAIEEQIASGGVEVYSIRLSAMAPEPARVSSAAPSAGAPAEPAPATRMRERPVPPAPPVAAGDETRGRSRTPRVAVIVFGLLVVAFVAWWVLQDRNVPVVTNETHPPAGTPIDSSRARADSVPAEGDTLATLRPAVRTPVRSDSAAVARRGGASRAVPPPTNPSDTDGKSGGTMLVNSSDIQVMDDLTRRFKGWYMIHISSFQTSSRAREDVAFLQSREFPVFIVFLDLGAKGKWYRVYAGPFQTRDEATEVKKNLDAIAQVRFTRIATIPD